MPRVALITLGCKVNQYETEVIEGLFIAKGYTVVPFTEQADVYVINTCSVTHLGERKSRQFIRRAVRLNREATIVVTGCYAQTASEEIAGIPGVDVVIGTQQRRQIVDIVEKVQCKHSKLNLVTDIMHTHEFEDIPLYAAPGRTRAFLKIQEGCNNFCTYCIIPYARGPLRSRPLDSIAAEGRKLVQAGFKEIVLTGIHLGAYGRDMNLQLTDAIKVLLPIDGLQRLRLSSLESIEVSDELIDLLKHEHKLCRQLHLPLQAGEDSVLKRMNRHYTTADFARLIDYISGQVPDIIFTTDIIVGFPGETDENFQQALHFIATMPFAKIHIFPYSKRSGTPAAAYPDQVGEDVKKQREKMLAALAEQMAQAQHRQYIGRVMPVLFETEHQDVMDGLTDNYIRVFAPYGENMLGQIRNVKLEKIYHDGLWGSIV